MASRPQFVNRSSYPVNQLNRILRYFHCYKSVHKDFESEWDREIKWLKGREPILASIRAWRKRAEQRLYKLHFYGKEFHNRNTWIDPVFGTTYHKFASRQGAYQKLFQALVTEDAHPIVGIYGAPGVGKTFMLEQALEEAKDKKIFDKVTRAYVGRGNIDLKKLQDQLAGYIDFHLESQDSEKNRASQLKNILMDGGKTLVILDDVHGIIPLMKIGIPFCDGSSNSCKIVLTSQSQKVCLLNNCKEPIQINTLTKFEALAMFDHTVGTSKIKSLQDMVLAANACERCAGLPLLIDTVGKALKPREEDSWKDGLYQLDQYVKFEEFNGIIGQVNGCLEMSFEMLTDSVKTCILLCSLFPPHEDIEIKMLFHLATGSQLLDSGDDIYELIEILKSSSPLLPGKHYYSFKMQNIIRNVARSIAARDPTYAFSYIECRAWLPDITDYRTRKLLQLDLKGDNVRFPENMVCPDLHTLWLQCNNHSQKLSGGLFTNLKSILIKGMSFSQHQLSIQPLKKLRMLILDSCDVHESFLRSLPNNLETLSIWGCNLPSPLDLPVLENLKKLELFSRTPVELVPNTLSSLSGKDVLIPGGGYRWILLDNLQKSVSSQYKSAKPSYEADNNN